MRYQLRYIPIADANLRIITLTANVCAVFFFLWSLQRFSKVLCCPNLPGSKGLQLEHFKSVFRRSAVFAAYT